MKWAAYSASMLLLAQACAPSGPEGPDSKLPELRLRFLTSAEGCGEAPLALPPPGMPPPDAARVRFTVLAADGTTLLSRELAVDASARCEDADGNVFACPFDADTDGQRERQLLIEELPTEQPLSLRAEIEDEAGVVRWSGRREGLEISPGGERLVQLLLTRHEVSSCVGGGFPSVFGSATPLVDGTVLLAGGFDRVSAACGADCFVLEASSRALLYDPRSGTLTPAAGRLGHPRGLHSTAVLPDGRVVLVGGSERLELDLGGSRSALLWEARPLDSAGASTTFELYDPKTRSFVGPGLLRESRAAAALAVRPDGKVWVVGGAQRVGDPPGLAGEAARSVEIIEATHLGEGTTRAAPGPSTLAGRIGARLLRVPGAGPEGPWVLVGGSGQSDLPVELLRDGQFFAPQDAGWAAFPSGAPALPNLFLPLVVAFGDQRSFLVAGGAAVEPDAAEQPLRWLRSRFSFRVLAADGRLEELGNGLTPRLFAAAVALHSGRVLVLGGVVEDMGAGGSTVTDGTTALDETGLPSTGPRLRWPRAGHVSARLPDGNVLSAGGFVLAVDQQGPEPMQFQSTVEVLNPGFDL